MAIRRKLKKERELVSDIHKRFRCFCECNDCQDCMFHDTSKEGKDCELEYIQYLLKKHIIEEDKENGTIW